MTGSQTNRSPQNVNELLVTLNKNNKIIDINSNHSKKPNHLEKMIDRFRLKNIFIRKEYLKIPIENPISTENLAFINKNIRKFKAYIKNYSSNNNEIVVIKKDGMIIDIIEPGKTGVFFKKENITSETINYRDCLFTIQDNIIDFLDTLGRKNNKNYNKIYKIEKIPNGFVGLLKYKENIINILHEGIHYLWNTDNLLTISLNETASEIKPDESINNYIKKEINYNKIIDVKTDKQEIAIVFMYGKIIDLKPPATRAKYWNINNSIEIKYLSDNCPLSDDGNIKSLTLDSCSEITKQFIDKFTEKRSVPKGYIGYLFLEPPLSEIRKQIIELFEGEYIFWNFRMLKKLHLVDLRPQIINIDGISVESSDGFEFAIDYLISWKREKETTIQLTEESLSLNVTDYLIKEINYITNKLAMITPAKGFINTKSKEIISEQLNEALPARAKKYNIHIDEVIVKRIKKPYSLNKIFNDSVVSKAKNEIKSKLILD